MLECCARLLEPQGVPRAEPLLDGAFVHAGYGRAAGVRCTAYGQYGELCFTDRAGKQLPLGTYYRLHVKTWNHEYSDRIVRPAERLPVVRPGGIIGSSRRIGFGLAFLVS